MGTIILFIAGLVLLIKGADLLINGAGSIASRLGVSEMIIGLTIVSFGTSAPELLVNVIASLEGAADIGLGNIIGSNISNILLILGIAALIRTLKIKQSTTTVEIPLNILAALAFIIITSDARLDGHASLISRSDGLMLILFFCIFLAYTYRLAKATREKKPDYVHYKLPNAILLVIAGLIGLVYGGKWVVEGAVELARLLHLSEALIAITIIGVGTSLPELATSAVAAYKGKTDIAIGNVVGSNLFNLFWVLGLSATIKPIQFNPSLSTDAWFYLGVTLLLSVFSFAGKHRHIAREEGIAFLILYIGYLAFLVWRG